MNSEANPKRIWQTNRRRRKKSFLFIEDMVVAVTPEGENTFHTKNQRHQNEVSMDLSSRPRNLFKARKVVHLFFC
jgi:hypothetical protein